jgi:shikimate dehydrogenase
MLNGKTKVYAIFGNPVKHSFSPLMQNIAFSHHQLDAVYVPFEVLDLKDAVGAVRSLQIQGLSITIPFKIQILPLLDEIDLLADKIGAVNTVLNTKGYLKGFNTDGLGACNALLSQTSLTGKKIAIIGFGGAARAIAFSLAEYKPAQIMIWGLDDPGAHAYCADLLKTGIPTSFTPIHNALDYDILINCSPVGMDETAKQSPIPDEFILSRKIVFDIVYNPKMTTLLQKAKAKQCQLLFGYEMLLNQGVEQFKIWTGLEAPIKKMKKALIKASKL